MKIEIKSYKTCAGRDGYAFSYTLYLDGVKAAEVTNEGCGGCNLYRWSDQVGGRSKMKDALLAHCRIAVVPIIASWGYATPVAEMHEEILDIVLEDVVGKIEEDKALKKLCKTKVVFRIEGDPEGTWRNFKGDWATKKIEFEFLLKKEFSKKLIEIANKRFA